MGFLPLGPDSRQDKVNYLLILALPLRWVKFVKKEYSFVYDKVI